MIVLDDQDDQLEIVVSKAAAVLRAGGVVLLPTDTVYGIAALPGDRAATEQLFALKGRAARTPLAVLCAGVDQAVELAAADVEGAVRAVGSRWWPGPLTLVVPRAPAADLHLGHPSHTIGLRVPDHVLVRALAAEVGPIAATSANRHGERTAATAVAAAESLRGDVALVVDGGTVDGSASTVIDATSSPWAVLRSGPLPSEEILALAERH